jgi:sugar lactone lactonase YvrE
MSDALATMLESPGVERLATGFGFTEGPLWHPEGFLYFVDLRRSQLLRWQPGKGVEIVREHTGEGNGLTFDRQGRLIMCEGANRRVSRTEADGSVVPLVERWQGKRLNRPNDVVCHSDGSLYFTDPGMRVPPEERDLDSSPVFRVTPDGTVSSATAECEYPNGLAFSPDERTLFVSNTRTRMFIHAFDVQPDGSLTNHRTFASMSPPEESVPDGMKVDVEGRIFCTGPGGTWVFDPSGIHLGTMRSPEIPANCAFGGPDYRTLFLTARTSLYAVRVKVPGTKVL